MRSTISPAPGFRRNHILNLIHIIRLTLTFTLLKQQKPDAGSATAPANRLPVLWQGIILTVILTNRLKNKCNSRP